MKPVVDVKELLDKLEENRGKHRLVFEAALVSWRREAEAQVAAMAKALSAGKYPELRLSLPLPTDHTRDYDRAIVMIHMHTGTTIELSEADARQFIQDDWDWKRQWVAASSRYAAATVEQVYGEGEEEELTW